jgi:sec-independent protein translocase protein TatA
VKGFKDAVKEEQNKSTELPRQADASSNTIDVEVKDKQNS